MVRAAAVLDVHCTTWGLWFASRQDLLRHGVVMDPGRTTLSSLWASLLGDLPRTPPVADPGSLTMARRLFALPGAEHYLPEHPLSVRMRQVRRVFAFLASRDIDIAATPWPQPQATVLTLAERLRDMLREDGCYAPSSAPDLIIEHAGKHPGFAFPFLQRFAGLRFLDCDYLSPRDIRLLRLLCLRHPDIDFMFEIYQNPLNAVFEHDRLTAGTLEAAFIDDQGNGPENFRITTREPEQVTAFSALVGQRPKQPEHLMEIPDKPLHRDWPRLDFHETQSPAEARGLLRDLLDENGAPGETLVAVCGGDDNAEVCAGLAARTPVSSVASRRLSGTSVYARLLLPLTMLADSQTDIAAFAALACDCLPDGATRATEVRLWLSPRLADQARRGMTLRDIIRHGPDMPPETPAAVRVAAHTAQHVLSALGGATGDELGHELYRHWQRIASSLLRRFSHDLHCDMPWLDRMMETGATLTLGRLIIDAFTGQGDACTPAEATAMLRQWGDQTLQRVLEAGTGALLVTAADAPLAAGRRHALFVHADADTWPGHSPRHPLGEAAGGIGAGVSLAPGPDTLSVALQRLSRWGTEAGDITLIASSPVQSNRDLPAAIPWMECLDTALAVQGVPPADKDEAADNRVIRHAPRAYMPLEAGDAAKPRDPRFGRLNLRRRAMDAMGFREFPRQTPPDIEPAARPLAGMLHTDTAALTRRAMGDTLAILSPSRLNRFYRCPWAFLITDVLHITPPQEAELGLASIEEGSMVHGALARLYRHLLHQGGGPVWLPDVARRENLMDLADRHSAAEVRAKRRGGVDIGEPLARRIAAIVRRVVALDLARHGDGGWRVTAVETPVALHPEDRDFSLHGVIDRIEFRPADGEVRLVDIKVSGAVNNDHLSVPSPGRSADFQMPLYVLMADGAQPPVLPPGTRQMSPALLAALAPVMKDTPNRNAPAKLFARRVRDDEPPEWTDELLAQVGELHRQMHRGWFLPWPVREACATCPLGPACRCE